MKVKVCGMTDVKNLKEILVHKPDFVGFIFYEKSPRNIVDEQVLRQEMQHTRKVGVFVNEDADTVINLANAYQLDHVQLHGDESPMYCQSLKMANVSVIKAFSVSEGFDFRALKAYTPFVDYFLFDAKGAKRGGNGMKFDWSILSNYELSTPFFLSGGISEQDIEEVKLLDHPQLYAVDVNSSFEMSPGIKDAKKVKTFIDQLSNQL